jgi:hypothetical protein
MTKSPLVEGAGGMFHRVRRKMKIAPGGACHRTDNSNHRKNDDHLPDAAREG